MITLLPYSFGPPACELEGKKTIQFCMNRFFFQIFQCFKPAGNKYTINNTLPAEFLNHSAHPPPHLIPVVIDPKYAAGRMLGWELWLELEQVERAVRACSRQRRRHGSAAATIFSPNVSLHNFISVVSLSYGHTWKHHRLLLSNIYRHYTGVSSRSFISTLRLKNNPIL